MFYNYRNHPNNFVRIHRASCSYCKSGIGVQMEILNGLNGEWHGDFKTYKLALNNAQQLITEMRIGTQICNCKRCKPN